MKYAPSSAASCLKSQGSSTTPHGPGGKVPSSKDGVRVSGMGHSAAKVSSILNRPAPSNGK